MPTTAAIQLPMEMADILREAAGILAGTLPMREPIVDELHGFAAMLDTRSNS